MKYFQSLVFWNDPDKFCLWKPGGNFKSRIRFIFIGTGTYSHLPAITQHILLMIIDFKKACCTFGSVADPDPGSGTFWPLDPGSGIGNKSGSGSGMNNTDHISESEKKIFGWKYLNSLMWIRDPGWKKVGSGIRNKHPGSATLLTDWNCILLHARMGKSF